MARTTYRMLWTRKQLPETNGQRCMQIVTAIGGKCTYILITDQYCQLNFLLFVRTKPMTLAMFFPFLMKPCRTVLSSERKFIQTEHEKRYGLPRTSQMISWNILYLDPCIPKERLPFAKVLKKSLPLGPWLFSWSAQTCQDAIAQKTAITFSSFTANHLAGSNTQHNWQCSKHSMHRVNMINRHRRSKQKSISLQK